MKRTDFWLFIGVLVITLFGLFIIYDASTYIAFKDFGDKYHYIKDQLVWAVLGISSLIFFTFFDYKKLYNLALPLLLVAIGMLVAVFFPGFGLKLLGAHRWINLRFFLLQPAEFVKLTLAIYLAAWFSNKEKERLQAFLLLMGFVLFLVILEPDMGTAIVILAEAVVLYFLSGANILYFLSLVPALGVVGLILIKIAPYRAARLTTFLNSGDSSQTSYHVRQILIALGTGGLTGVGVGNSLQKYAYLPENTTDSIFAILAEELGFVGSMIVILVLAFIVYRCFVNAMRSRDTFGKLLGGGIATFLGVQMIINLAAQTTLLPLTGIPLPFISYGGSALIVDLSAVGIMLNISKQGYVKVKP